LLAGDDIVDHPLRAEDLAVSRALLISDQRDLLPADRALVEAQLKSRPVFTNVAEVLEAVRPAVQLKTDKPVRALPRVKPGSGVIHLLNWGYDPARDDVESALNVHVTLDLKALGLPPDPPCSLVQPGGEPQSLKVAGGAVDVPALGLWALLVLGRP